MVGLISAVRHGLLVKQPILMLKNIPTRIWAWSLIPQFLTELQPVITIAFSASLTR